MRGDRFAVVPILLGIGMVVAALLGPLMLDVIQYRNSPAAIRQLQGGEVISLLAAAPLAIVSGLVWHRRRTLAAALAIGPGLYAVYMYVQYVLAGQYDRYAGNVERFFPLFLTLIILGWITALRGWSVLGGDRGGAVPMPARRIRRTLGGLLLAIGLLYGRLARQHRRRGRRRLHARRVRRGSESLLADPAHGPGIRHSGGARDRIRLPEPGVGRAAELRDHRHADAAHRRRPAWR